MSKPRNDAALLSLLVLLTGKSRREIISEALAAYFEERAIEKAESALKKTVRQPELTIDELAELTDKVVAREAFRNFDVTKAKRQ